MHVSQKMILTLGCRVAFLYVGPGNPKFSHIRWNSFKKGGWENILYPGHYGMQRDYRSSWEAESQTPSQPLSIPGAVLPKRPNSNVFKRKSEGFYGLKWKKILLQLCLEFCRKDIISNICFTMYLKIRLFIKFLGFSIRAWLSLEMLNRHTCEMPLTAQSDAWGSFLWWTCCADTWTSLICWV